MLVMKLINLLITCYRYFSKNSTALVVNYKYIQEQDFYIIPLGESF